MKNREVFEELAKEYTLSITKFRVGATYINDAGIMIKAIDQTGAFHFIGEFVYLNTNRKGTIFHCPKNMLTYMGMKECKRTMETE